MSTSVFEICRKNRQARKTWITYLLLTVFCSLFNQIYNLFGHGVTSGSLARTALFPLLGGVLPFFLLWLFVPQADCVRGYRLLYNGYNSGIAALVLKNMLVGIFEIAGTSSSYMLIFAIFGWILVIAAPTAYLANLYRRESQPAEASRFGKPTIVRYNDRQ